MNKVIGKVIKGIPCLVYTYNDMYYAIAINGSGLVAIW